MPCINSPVHFCLNVASLRWFWLLCPGGINPSGEVDRYQSVDVFVVVDVDVVVAVVDKQRRHAVTAQEFLLRFTSCSILVRRFGYSSPFFVFSFNYSTLSCERERARAMARVCACVRLIKKPMVAGWIAYVLFLAIEFFYLQKKLSQEIFVSVLQYVGHGRFVIVCHSAHDKVETAGHRIAFGGVDQSLQRAQQGLRAFEDVVKSRENLDVGFEAAAPFPKA